MSLPDGAPPGPHAVAEVARDEIWTVRSSGPVCIERRLDEGFALSRLDPRPAIESGSDLPSFVRATPGLPDDLATTLRRMTTFNSREVVDRVRSKRLAGPASIRIRTVARWCGSIGNGRGHESVRTTIGVETGAPAVRAPIIASPATLGDDLDLLESLDRDGAAGADAALPILWAAGTGAVLLHEAIGHPAAASATAVAWPEWLAVDDDPAIKGLGHVEVDDAGLIPSRAVLTRGERPTAWRRESWRDVPARRMTNLVVRGRSPRVARPKDRIDIRLVRGGSWDPVSDEVTVEIAIAERVHGSRRTGLAPFTINAPRRAIARSIRGVDGPVVRYPGVLCHDEGQRIPVGSFAPGILTDPFADR